MKTLQFLVKLAGYRRVILGTLGTVSILWALVPLWPGLIIRRIFDSLTGESTLQPGLWTLVAIMVGVYTLQIAIAIAWNLLYSAAFNAIRALLSKNLFQNLLDHRGARTGNEPPGQLISHFRDDRLWQDYAVESPVGSGARAGWRDPMERGDRWRPGIVLRTSSVRLSAPGTKAI